MNEQRTSFIVATQFVLQIRMLEALEKRRDTSRVSFLMCPFGVRAADADRGNAPHAARASVR